MSQQLTRSGQWDQRSAIENPPQTAVEALRREDLARLVLLSEDLTMNGANAPVFRELQYLSVGAAALVSGIVALAHPRGFRVHSLVNRSGVQLFVSTTLQSIASVVGLAGFVAGGAQLRAGFVRAPDLLVVTGTATNPIASTNGWNLLGGQAFPFDPPLWVPPSLALVILNPVVNSALDLLLDVSTPGTPDVT